MSLPLGSGEARRRRGATAHASGSAAEEGVARHYQESGRPIAHRLGRRQMDRLLAAAQVFCEGEPAGSLTQMRFDQLKLDRGFVANIHRGQADAIVPQSIIALGQSLGVPVLAEGIESARQAEVLQELGCELGQGYLFSRPLSVEAVEALLDRSSEVGYVLQSEETTA